MDRDTELKNNYSEISLSANLDYDRFSQSLEKFYRRQDLKVAGEWYLFEMEGRLPFVTSAAHMADYGYTLEKMRHIGYLATPVKIFREE